MECYMDGKGSDEMVSIAVKSHPRTAMSFSGKSQQLWPFLLCVFRISR